MQCDGQDTTPQMWKFRWALHDCKRKEYRRGKRRGRLCTVWKMHSYTTTSSSSHSPIFISWHLKTIYLQRRLAVFLLFSTRSCRIAILKKTLPPYHPPQPSVIDNEIRLFAVVLLGSIPPTSYQGSIFHLPNLSLFSICTSRSCGLPIQVNGRGWV